MKRQLLLLLCFAGMASVLWADGKRDDVGWTADIRLDVRTSVGGSILHGTERISPVAENEAAAATLTMDGASASGWNVSAPQYDTTKLEDGWHGFVLMESDGTTESSMLVLNGSNVVIHEGVLTENETWATNAVHIVRHWVRVPEGVTLTIAPQAVVKFCEDTGILVDGTLNAANAVFTYIFNDAIGGDTDMNGVSYMLAHRAYDIVGEGEIDVTGVRDSRDVALRQTDDAAETAIIRLDVRSSVGGSLLHGTERISPVAESEAATATLTMDGASASEWNVSEPQYDTIKLEDGWHGFVLTESDGTTESSMLVLNGSNVVIHEGVLTENETWAANAVHIVRHWVRVPAGVTLTIASQAVVKFCEDTGIQVDGTLNAANAVFTYIFNDAIGGDTDMNGVSYMLAHMAYEIVGDGEIDVTGVRDSRDVALRQTDDAAETATVRLDVRTSVGGTLLHGMERISPFAESEAATAILKVDDASASGWNMSELQYDTTKLEDGWHDFALTEGDSTAEASLLVLNGSNVVIHEGVLSANETWAADAVHIVRHWVRVPEGITLTIASQAVVKFCEDTGIQVDGALNAADTIFTYIYDDVVGGDTDMNGVSYMLTYRSYEIIGDGAIDVTSVRDSRDVALRQTDDAEETATVRLDVRTSVGGTLLHGTERISSVAESENTAATLTVNGAAADGWNVSALQYDTTKLEDGWHGFTLTEGDSTTETNLLVLNGSNVAIHEGVLTKNETWSTDMVHVVRHWIRVPEGITLTIAPQAVVKFCENTGILVEGVLKADGAVMTAISDDTIGGDTDMNGDVHPLVYQAYTIMGDEENISMDGCVNKMFSGVGIANAQGSSELCRLDVRTSFGGKVLHGDEYISAVAENGENDSQLTVDGAAMSDWSAESPWIDSTRLADGQWHVFALNEGDRAFETELLPMNGGDTVVHEGVLAEDETWMAGKIHIVRHWVRIPDGVTLTIASQAVVKFCVDTGISVDEGGRLVGGANAVLTTIMDDSVGGDTDMNGVTTVKGYGFFDITGDGEMDVAGCERRGMAVLEEDTVWKEGDVIHVVRPLKVPADVSLTILEGAIVKFETGAALVADGGAIESNGALFTHIADDSDEAGGDTNGDGYATLPVHDAYALPDGFVPNSDGLDANGNEIRYIMPPPYVGGTIKNGETKTLAGHRVHRVTGNVAIASGGKLVIQPGAIVKMASGLVISVQNGELEALGTRDLPIVITSIKDDAHGGDSNGDENETMPQVGDWGRIETSGTVAMDYVTIAYANNAADRGVIHGSGGTVVFDNGVIEHSDSECVRMNSGSFTARNSVFRNAMAAFGYSGGAGTVCINCIVTDVAVGCRGGGKSFTNSIFYNVEQMTEQDGESSSFQYCVFYNPVGYGVQSFVKCGSDDNVWDDPLFTNAANGDYTLAANSPCIDAGDGTVSPATDYWGNSRMNVLNVTDNGKPDENGFCPDIGIYEMPGDGDVSTPDLYVTDIVFETKTYHQGDEMVVSWQDVNDGDAVAFGPWRDVVSLVWTDGTMTTVVEAASVDVSASLKKGQSQLMSASFNLPSLLSGEWRIQVETNQSGDVFEGEDIKPNILLSNESFIVEMDGIPIGNSSLKVTPGTQTFVLTDGAADGTVLRLTAADGVDLTVTASTGSIPTEDEYQWRAVQGSDGQLILEIPDGTEGDVFVTIVNNDGEAVDVSVRRSATAAGVFLRPGWNLIAAPGELAEDANAALFAELKPFKLDRENMAYVWASLPMSSGEAMWIFSRVRRRIPFVYEDEGNIVGGLTDKRGWQMVGVSGEEDATLDHVLAAWQWSAGKWKPLEINDGKVLLKAGRGYFIYKE